jgi:predicted Rossmann fold flavoprotein
MAAALAAARAGAKVTLLERGKALGRKVLASGAGRCNLTNTDLGPGHYHGECRALLSRFGHAEAIALFEGLGLLLATEADGRVFPRCGKAQAVVDVLRSALNEFGVDVRLGCGVERIRRQGKGFSLGTLEAERVVLCCGGPGYPQIGGTDSGLRLAEALGHDVTQVTPSLVPLCAEPGWTQRLHGIRVEAALRAGDFARSRGELLFTSYGVSGPAVLDISREVARRGGAECSVDLFPEMDEDALLELLRRRLERFGRRSAKGLLCGMLPDRMPSVFLKEHGLSEHAPLPASALGKLCDALKSWRFKVTGPRGWDEAMVSAGGVDLKGMDLSTMGSTRVDGLFFAGEMLDVDGDSGGYNLHFAWASGTLAGASAAA